MEKELESDSEELITDDVGKVEKIKGENIFKEILEIGEGKEKPSDIDTVIISTKCVLRLHNNNELEKVLYLPELSYDRKEISLCDNENPIPKAISLGIQTMRKKEKANIYIKMNYIFKFLDKNLNKFGDISSKELFDENFRKEYLNEKLICEVTIHEFFVCVNLMDRGEIRKKILKKGSRSKYARNPDIVKYNLSCISKNKIIYEKKNSMSELDKNNIFEIEKRILQNLKIGEISEVRVKPSYMRDRNKDFLSYFNMDNEADTLFTAELLNVEIFDYVFKPDKDIISKKRILLEGFGRDSPDRESLVKLKIQIKFEGKILFNNFEEENIIECYLNNNLYTNSYPTWRDEINQEYGINEIGEEVNLKRDQEIFSKFSTDEIKTCDLRLYTLPLIVRKVLVHMKRNEVVYVKTNYIDCLDFQPIDNLYLHCLGDSLLKRSNIEIFIHLFEFLERPSFSKLNYDEKFFELSTMKEIANCLFNEGKIFRSGKIYQNINSRFNYGDVFKEKSGRDNFEQVSEVYKQLEGLRLSTFNNCAAVKMKLAKYFSCYDLTKKIITEFDRSNLKANYLYGRSCIYLKYYDEAIKTFKFLNEMNPDNKEFSELMRDAEKLKSEDLKKQKSVFKKMIFSNSE